MRSDGDVLDILKPGPHGHAGIAYQGVDAAEFSDRYIDNPAAFVVPGHISGHGNDARPLLPHRGGNAFQFVLSPGGQHQAGSLPGQLIGELLADAG